MSFRKTRSEARKVTKTVKTIHVVTVVVDLGAALVCDSVCETSIGCGAESSGLELDAVVEFEEAASAEPAVRGSDRSSLEEDEDRSMMMMFLSQNGYEDGLPGQRMPFSAMQKQNDQNLSNHKFHDHRPHRTRSVLVASFTTTCTRLLPIRVQNYADDTKKTNDW